MPEYSVSAPVYPSENGEAVLTALRTLFPEARLTRMDKGISGTADSIAHLLELIIEQKIRYSFLEELARNFRGECFSIQLNKQAATVGKVNLVDETKPLGNISLSGKVERGIIFFERELKAEGYISSRYNINRR
jgi:predicted RNA binding protein with dsRBD fold (UPF0201 family)